MERYIPGFKVVELQTFQVPIYDHNKGTTKTVDFFHDGAYIEYHPPRFWREGKKFGDFKNAKEYFDYRRHLKSLTTPQEKREYREEIQEKLSERYADERRAIISRFKNGAEIDLIVAKDASDVYDRIILRFSPKPPSKAEFMRAFHDIELELKEIESDSKKAIYHRNFKRS
jgi:hypothetical protein